MVFFSRTNMCIFYGLFISALLLDVYLSLSCQQGVANPLSGLTLSKASNWISNAICRGLFFVFNDLMLCGWLWNWWNCWTSLFKLPVRNDLTDWLWNDLTKWLWNDFTHDQIDCCFSYLSYFNSEINHGSQNVFWVFTWIGGNLLISCRR